MHRRFKITMDNSSIITQVVRRREFLAKTNCSESCALFSEESTLSAKFTIDVNKSDKKNVSRLVKSLFCCFELKSSKLSTFTICKNPERIKRELIIENPDFIVPVEIDNIVHQVYVRKRPHVDEFLRKIGALFECVLFTASLGKYAEPVADLIDKDRIFKYRLMREACVLHKGNYVKDLTKLGRCVESTIIVDNSPISYAFHPENALPVQSWYDDVDDKQLLDLLPILHDLSKAEDIYPILRNFNAKSSESSSPGNYVDESSEYSVPTSESLSQCFGQMMV